jgi:hypothetical protein
MLVLPKNEMHHGVTKTRNSMSVMVVGCGDRKACRDIE